MNLEIRKFLIDQCVIEQPIYYEDVARKLNLNLRLDKDRQILSKTLGEVSTFEHENGRPLISLIAIYKKENDQGNGFYNLSEELGIGKSSKLRKEFYGFTEIEKSKKFWRDDFNFQQFYNLKIPIYNPFENPFINIDEINFFRKWVNRVYDKSNKDHFLAKEYLLDTAWYKTKF